MSTRAQIYVTEEFTDDGFAAVRQFFNYYHHHDGYLHGVGKEIYSALIDTFETMDIQKHIINQFADILEEFGGYEAEHDTDESHGDVEFIYNVRFTENDVIIFVSQHDFEYGWFTIPYTLDELMEIFDPEQVLEEESND